ncbi:hypothetical protein [Candidatus Magnetobacterium casense]|uniref:Uncharacterized protein n=1 Tax=Candidatus Magnetobacterium casense TaxID=1455061 RepID=A0ABS6S1C4_9BACT|nr:hypothetical protein [Candidatus Magnetobacterium casensis]MBV6342442.1 hypothetical protein [Candidatus Magnetobacterium casensis]
MTIISKPFTETGRKNYEGIRWGKSKKSRGKCGTLRTLIDEQREREGKVEDQLIV